MSVFLFKDYVFSLFVNDKGGELCYVICVSDYLCYVLCVSMISVYPCYMFLCVLLALLANWLCSGNSNLKILHVMFCATL